MISGSYDFGKFMERVKDKDYLEILRLAIQEADYLEPLLYRVRGAVKRREMGGCEYVARLKEFIFFMRFGIKPSGVPDWAFRLYRPICENLISKGQLKPSILDLFARTHFRPDPSSP